MLALWQIIALWVLVPLALFFLFQLVFALVDAEFDKQPGPSQAWIKQQQQAYRSYNQTPVVKPPGISSRPYPRKSATYQEFLQKRDYS